MNFIHVLSKTALALLVLFAAVPAQNCTASISKAGATIALSSLDDSFLIQDFEISQSPILKSFDPETDRAQAAMPLQSEESPTDNDEEENGDSDGPQEFAKKEIARDSYLDLSLFSPVIAYFRLYQTHFPMSLTRERVDRPPKYIPFPLS
jgi:hypothetical protein